jgi:protein phosphatase
MPATNEPDTVDLIPQSGQTQAGRRGPTAVRVVADVAALSDRGAVRERNEDHFLIGRFGRALEVLCTNLPDGAVPSRAEETGYGLVVADGMGGMAAGDVASRLAIETLIQLVLHVPDWILRPDDASGDEALRRIKERYLQVDAALAHEAEEPALRGMGTTLTIAWNLGPQLFLAHAGDSRAYLLRGGTLHRLTRDHTLAQALADAGQVPAEEVATHRLRNVLVKWLGGGKDHEPDVQRLPLADGDWLLLCSDGLTDMVDDATIADHLRSAQDAASTCGRLVERALERGGKDNVTVALARYRFLPAG